MLKRSIHLTMFVAAFLGCALIWTSSGECSGNFVVPAMEVRPQNGSFALPATAFADGKAKHFVYKHSPNQYVRFFVVKSTDGIVRAAFDACDVCYRHQKGYMQQGDFMVCINCGLKFRTDKVNEVKGGCNPSPLKRVVQGDKIVISQDDVLSGLRFFQ